MKNKVVINQISNSMFRLSDEAIIEIIKRKNKNKTVEIDDCKIFINGEEFNDIFSFCETIPRHDPILIQVIEEMGEDAETEYTSLQIEEIEGNKYLIWESECGEKIILPNNIEWKIIEK